MKWQPNNETREWERQIWATVVKLSAHTTIKLTKDTKFIIHFLIIFFLLRRSIAMTNTCYFILNSSRNQCLNIQNITKPIHWSETDEHRAPCTENDWKYVNENHMWEKQRKINALRPNLLLWTTVFSLFLFYLLKIVITIGLVSIQSTDSLLSFGIDCAVKSSSR